MNIIYPINGKNERMGSLFKVPKHLLLLEGKSILLHSITTLLKTFPTAHVLIITNKEYSEAIQQTLNNYSNITIKLVDKTKSQVDTLTKVTHDISGPIAFVDCDIVPRKISPFNKKYTTVFTFKNTHRLLNYSNFKANSSKTIIDCNEKQKLYANAGAGIYYFPDVSLFNKYSTDCNSVSECIYKMLQDGIRAKVNTDSVIGRYGTLQDIYVDNFSFRKSKAKDLSTGFTKNKVYKTNKFVIKEGTTVADEYAWYAFYKNKKHIPKIVSYSSNMITMSYIKRDADVQLDDVFELIDEYKQYDALNDLQFDAYIANITNHLSNNKGIINGPLLLDKLRTINLQPTFCHGDLSIMNIIPTKLGLKLIDPLYSKSKFGSYELDIAKLCFSFKFYKNDSASYTYIKQRSDLHYIDCLIAAEAVRVASYRSEYNFIAENLINELFIV